MNFPLKPSPETFQVPGGASCLGCSIKVGEVEGFIRLTAGAMLYSGKKRDRGGPSQKMDTVFSLWYHGAHPVIGTSEDGRSIMGMDNLEYTMDIVEPVRGGQVDIHFCSTSCLSAFFEAIVAQFDAGIQRTTKAEPNE